MQSLPVVAIVTTMPPTSPATGCSQPNIDVPAYPCISTISYCKSVPDGTLFPRTEVDLCYTDEHLHVSFIAYGEVSFYFNASQSTNDDIWKYEVMEAFIQKGTDDPQTYLEFEVNPNNVTYQAFVYNPSKLRANGEPFDHRFISDPAMHGFSSMTKLDMANKLWRSDVKIPLGLFNVDKGEARGTQWRMNFFRTVTSPNSYPKQELGAWNPPDKADFHITSFLGRVHFV